MTSMRPILAFGLVALALLAPAASAQDAPGIKNPTASTPTTMYFHLNGFQNFPINTQKPDDSFAEAAGVGLATHTGTCIPDNPATGPLAGTKYHTYYGYSSPGYVQYNVTEDGRPRFHPERGLSYDILFDTSAPFNLKWFLSTNSGVPGPAGVPADPNTVPIVIPQVVVRGTLRTGDEITVGDEGYNSGQLIAQGMSEPATLATQATTGATYHQVDGANVYEFDVPMAFQATSIPKEGGYSLRVDVFVKVDGLPCNENPDQSLMPNLVRTYTGPDLRPSMTFAITDPIRIEYMHPQFIGDDLVIHTSSNSPWGNYDVDESVADGTRGTQGGITVTITGPSEARSLYRAAVVQRYEEHDHHTEAVDVSYIWPYKEDGARDGVYTITMTVKNDQDTAEAVGVAQFEIGRNIVTRCGGLESVANADSNQKCESEQQDEQGRPVTAVEESPALQVVAVLGALVAAAFVLRRRTA